MVDAGERSIVRCRTDEDTGKVVLLGPELITEKTEKITLIRQRLRAAQDRQKVYADKERREVTFEVGDVAFLKVSSHQGL